MVSEKRTIDVQLLRAFVATAKHASVTAAGEALGMAKSAVSKQLNALEGALQVRLFERSSRRISLTGEGRQLLPGAESILAELDHFVIDAQQQVVQVRGTVRVAASPEFGAFLSERFLPLVLKRHAALQVAMSLAYGFDDLQDPGFDLAFRLGSMQDDRLVGRHLGDLPRVLVCSTGYARSTALESPADLARANVLLFSDRELAEEWTLQRAARSSRRHVVKVQGNLGVRGFEALAAAARAGLGVARVPSFVAQAGLADGSLVHVLPDWHSPSIPVYLAYRAGISRVSRVRAVLDAAMEDIPQLLSSMGPQAVR